MTGVLSVVLSFSLIAGTARAEDMCPRISDGDEGLEIEGTTAELERAEEIIGEDLGRNYERFCARQNDLDLSYFRYLLHKYEKSYARRVITLRLLPSVMVLGSVAGIVAMQVHAKRDDDCDIERDETCDEDGSELVGTVLLSLVGGAGATMLFAGLFVMLSNKKKIEQLKAAEAEFYGKPAPVARLSLGPGGAALLVRF